MRQQPFLIPARLIAAFSLTMLPGAYPRELDNIAQYQVVNAVGLAGELTPTLNDIPRPRGFGAGDAMGSMGTRSPGIVFGGNHPACSGAGPRRVALPPGTLTTVVYYPQKSSSGTTGDPAPAELRVATITHPFTRGRGPKTLHLLAVTEREEIPLSIAGGQLQLRRLSTRSVRLEKPAFEISSEGTRLAGGSFDERDHGTCILFDAPDGRLVAVVTGAHSPTAAETRKPALEEIAQYQVINAVGLPGQLHLILNDTPRPDPYPAGATMGSMGTRARQIVYGGRHGACANATSREVPLAAGTVTTVVFYPAITRSETSGRVTRVDLEIATLSHPFTRGAGPKTLHLLVTTERSLLPVSVNGKIFPLRRLLTTPVELTGSAFEIAIAGARLAHGQFDERDHLACIVFDAPDGGTEAVVFD